MSMILYCDSIGPTTSIHIFASLLLTSKALVSRFSSIYDFLQSNINANEWMNGLGDVCVCVCRCVIGAGFPIKFGQKENLCGK